jgi:hypothetical protein
MQTHEHRWNFERCFSFGSNHGGAAFRDVGRGELLPDSLRQTAGGRPFFAGPRCGFAELEKPKNGGLRNRREPLESKQRTGKVGNKAVEFSVPATWRRIASQARCFSS